MGSQRGFKFTEEDTHSAALSRIKHMMVTISALSDRLHESPFEGLIEIQPYYAGFNEYLKTLNEEEFDSKCVIADDFLKRASASYQGIASSFADKTVSNDIVGEYLMIDESRIATKLRADKTLIAFVANFSKN